MEIIKFKGKCQRCHYDEMVTLKNELSTFTFCANCGKYHSDICNCEFEYKLIIVSNGTRRVWEICKKCKHTGSKNFKLKDFDLSKLEKVFNSDISEKRKELVDHWEQFELKNISKYRLYLQSEEWKKKRNQVIERDNGFCRRCSNKGTDVHHLHYNNIYNEDLNDLILLCRSCHEKEHNL